MKRVFSTILTIQMANYRNTTVDDELENIFKGVFREITEIEGDFGKSINLIGMKY